VGNFVLPAQDYRVTYPAGREHEQGQAKVRGCAFWVHFSVSFQIIHRPGFAPPPPVWTFSMPVAGFAYACPRDTAHLYMARTVFIMLSAAPGVACILSRTL